MTDPMETKVSFNDLSISPTSKKKFGKRQSREKTLRKANNSLDPAFNAYLTNYSSSVNQFMQKHAGITAFASRQIATSDNNTRSPSPFRGNYPIKTQNPDIWEFNPNVTHQTSMTLTSFNLDQPSVTSIEKSENKFQHKLAQKRQAGKVKLPEMANKIYERKRIVDVKQFARKSRYTLKMNDFAFLDSQDLHMLDYNHTARDFNVQRSPKQMLNDTSSNALTINSKRSSTMMNKNLPQLQEKRLQMNQSKNDDAVKIHSAFYIPPNLKQQSDKLVGNSNHQKSKPNKMAKQITTKFRGVSMDRGINKSFLSPQIKTQTSFFPSATKETLSFQQSQTQRQEDGKTFKKSMKIDVSQNLTKNLTTDQKNLQGKSPIRIQKQYHLQKTKGTPQTRAINSNNMETYLDSLKDNASSMSKAQERIRQKAFDKIRLKKAAELRKNDLLELDQIIQELEIEHQESIWENMKDNYEPTTIVSKMIKKISQFDEENKEKFIEDILLPQKLKDQYINQEKMQQPTLTESAIESLFSDRSPPKSGVKGRLMPQLSLTSQETMILQRQMSDFASVAGSPTFRNLRSPRQSMVGGLRLQKAHSILSGQSEIKEEVDSEEEMNKQLQQEIANQQKNVISDKARYIDSLMYKTMKQSFLQTEVKEVFKPKSEHNQTDITKDFVRACFKQKAVPKPSLVIQNKIRKDLFALINTIVTPQQAAALGQSFKLIGQEVKEVCFSNNNLHDEDFSALLEKMITDQKTLQNLSRITYGKNNELGPKTLEVFQKLLIKKGTQRPLIQLALVGCKQRLSSIAPLINTLSSVENQLQVLLIPKLNLGDDGFQSICRLVEKSNSLRNLDISWSHTLSNSTHQLFEALAKNRVLQYLNLCMLSIDKENDLKGLKKFIKFNKRLLHVNFTGLLRTQKQVIGVIKAIKVNLTLLAVHLSHTPVITKSKQLQSYIRKKLGMYALQHKPKDRNQTTQVVVQSLKKDKLSTDKFQSECAQESKIAEYYGNQRIREVTVIFDDLLILQRTIGFPCMEGNQQWIGGTNCYICQRWQLTCFVHHPMQNRLDNPFSDYNQVQPNANDFALNGSFVSLMMLYGKKPWTEFKFMSVVEWIQRYDKEFLSLNDYIDYRFSCLDVSAKKLEVDKENMIARFKDDYIRNMKSKFKELFHSKDLPLQFSTLPNQVNFDQLLDMKLLLHTDFVKPTCKMEKFKIQPIAKQNDSESESELDSTPFMRTTPQVQEIPFVPKSRIIDMRVHKVYIPGREEMIRRFDKEKSVFKNWTVDTALSLEEAARNDMKHWKVQNFCKDPEDLKKVENLIIKRFDQIKHIFTVLISTPSFPNIERLDLSNWTQDAKLLDKTKTQISDIDRLFINTNTQNINSTEEDLKIPNKLYRYEFLEVLVRIANQKYREQKLAKTYAEALEKLLDYLQNSYQPPAWQGFRDNYLWEIQSNDVLQANQVHLEHILKLMQTDKSQNGLVCRLNCIDLVTEKTPVNLTERDAYFCFGMSKMTVQDESQRAHYQYNIYKPPEFYEYIGRVAMIKYQDDEDLTLSQKIQNLLDLMLPTFGIEPNAAEDCGSYKSSDESVDFDTVNLRRTLIKDFYTLSEKSDNEEESEASKADLEQEDTNLGQKQEALNGDQEQEVPNADLGQEEDGNQQLQTDEQ